MMIDQNDDDDMMIDHDHGDYRLKFAHIMKLSNHIINLMHIKTIAHNIMRNIHNIMRLYQHIM